MIQIGDEVKVTATPVELFSLGITKSTAEAISGQDFEVTDIRDYPPDRAQKMVYIGGMRTILWVLDSQVKKLRTESEGK